MASDDRSIVRLRRDARIRAHDRVVVEAPLEIRLHGRPFAVVMRTPGADRELAAGFLFSERVIESPDQLGTIQFCLDQSGVALGDGGVAPHQQVVDVRLDRSGETVDRLLAERRELLANAACGVCGRATIDSLTSDLAPVTAAAAVTPGVLLSLSATLRGAQPLFDTTGGLHAAGLFDLNGGLVASAEDVGRHNAVDKIVGRFVMGDALPLDRHVLLVSGRTSFEIVQKAWRAGIPILVAISAPSSLAIDTAERAGITLAGFARDGGCNLYTHPDRIA
jgi:FdhD protein